MLSRTTLWVSGEVSETIKKRKDSQESVDEFLKRVLEIKVSNVLLKTRELKIKELIK